MRVSATGASGFIGSTGIPELKAAGQLLSAGTGALVDSLAGGMAGSAPLNTQAVLKAVGSLVNESGIEALVIAFLDSYVNPAHGQRARDLVRGAFPEFPVTPSSEAAAEIGE